MRGNSRHWLLGLVSCGLLVFVLLAGATKAPAAAGGKGGLRVGVFDTRAVALAYTRSQFYQGKAVFDQAAKANAAGEKGDQKVAWARMKLQQQVFGKARVDDALAPVVEKLPAVAKAANVQAITSDFVFSTDSVEQVDITEQLVALYDPNAQTLTMIKDMKGKPPLSEEALMNMETAEHSKGR
jgi:hypothetical protein